MPEQSPKPASNLIATILYDRKGTADELLVLRTNTSIGVAILLGVAVAWTHGGAISASFTAFGAALGLGGLLGFLFGVPGYSKRPINIGRANNVAVGGGGQSTASAESGPPSAPGGAGPVAPGPTDVQVTPPAETASLKSTEASDAGAAVKAGGGKAGGDSDPGAPLPDTRNVSNLEQVADWVTKLLLGGGLTQMQRIPPKVWSWARLVALGVLRDQPQASEQAIVAQQAFAAGLLVYGFILGFFSGFLITKLQLGKAVSDGE